LQDMIMAVVTHGCCAGGGCLTAANKDLWRSLAATRNQQMNICATAASSNQCQCLFLLPCAALLRANRWAGDQDAFIDA
jgi:hypothetical protein